MQGSSPSLKAEGLGGTRLVIVVLYFGWAPDPVRVTTGDNSNYSDIPVRLRLWLSVWVVSVAGLGCGVWGLSKT